MINALKFIGPDTEHLDNLMKLLFASNSIAFEIDDDDIIVYPTTKPVDIDKIIEFSLFYPEDIIFISRIDEDNLSQDFYRIAKGKIVRKKKSSARRKKNMFDI